VRNSNERSNDRAREATASADKDVRGASAQFFKDEQTRLDKIHDRVRGAVQEQLQTAGAARSPLADKAAQQMDALRADQAARLRETAAAGASEKTVTDVVTRMIDEAVRMRDALTQEAREFKDRRADKGVDQERAADLKAGVEDALERNRKQQSALEAAQQDVVTARNAAGGDAARQAVLERDAAELSQRLDAYKARAEAIRNVNTLVEQQRLDLADRLLTAFRDADRGRRGGMSAEHKARDVERVNTLRQEEGTRVDVARARQFAVLDRKISELAPIKTLWDAAVSTTRDRDRQRGVEVSAESRNSEKRDLYNRVMDEFKKRLVEQNDTARQARALFEKDGFQFSLDRDQRIERTLPMLKDAELERGIDMKRHADLFRISGQHLDKIEQGGDPVSPDNLAFQIARDNMQMDAAGVLSEYVRQRVAERLKEQGLHADEDE